MGTLNETIQVTCIIWEVAKDTGGYKWIALSNTTLAVLLATLDVSITIIAMPNIFRGIHLDPLVPANSFYLQSDSSRRDSILRSSRRTGRR